MFRKTSLFLFVSLLTFLAHRLGCGEGPGTAVSALTAGCFSLLSDEEFPARRMVEKVFVWSPITQWPLGFNRLFSGMLAFLFLPLGVLASLNLFAVFSGLTFGFSYAFWRSPAELSLFGQVGFLLLVVFLLAIKKYEKWVFEHASFTGQNHPETLGSSMLFAFFCTYSFIYFRFPLWVLMDFVGWLLIWNIEKNFAEGKKFFVTASVVTCLAFVSW